MKELQHDPMTMRVNDTDVALSPADAGCAPSTACRSMDSNSVFIWRLWVQDGVAESNSDLNYTVLHGLYRYRPFPHGANTRSNGCNLWQREDETPANTK